MSRNICENCGKPITVMCFKGTGYCCELCRKALYEGTGSTTADSPELEGDREASVEADSTPGDPESQLVGAVAEAAGFRSIGSD